MSRGDSATINMVAMADAKLKDVEVSLVPALSQFVSVTPRTIPVMYKGVGVGVALNVAVPETT
jgi:hypothetical protein